MLSIHAFFSIINFAVLGPTCLYMAKSGRRKEGHRPSRVIFSKHLCGKKLTPFPKIRADNSACACSYCLILTKFTLLNKSKWLRG